MSSEVTFAERVRHIAGPHPFAWAASLGIPKANMTVWLDGARPQKKTLRMLEEKTGIAADWWLKGELPPPKLESGAPSPYLKDADNPLPPRQLLDAAPQPRDESRINVDALAAIIEGALKTAPGATPEALARHCAKIYAQAIEDGLITSDSVGDGHLDTAA